MRSHLDPLTAGNSVLERLARLGMPSELRRPAAAFRNQHERLLERAAAVEKSRSERDASLDEVGRTDADLDASVLELADRLVGAGLGRRTNPFSSLSRFSPGDLVRLAYATELREVRQLADQLAGRDVPADVARAVKRCRDGADAVEAALRELLGPEASYQRALVARDALLPDWNKALRSLKKHANAVWADDEATYQAVFAPADRLQRPVKRRKKAAAPEAPDAGAPPPDSAR